MVTDIESIKRSITPKTRIFIYNNYHNPTGASASDEELNEIAHMCREHDFWVLSDEAYFDIVYDGQPSRSIVALPHMLERTVILHTWSKSFAMTGWRLGAAVGPAELIQWITKLNTNDEACTTHFVQYAGIAAFSPESRHFVKELVADSQKRRDLVVDLVNKIPGFHAFKPKAAFYVYCNVTKAMELLKSNTVEEFRKLILNETGVSFCTNEHFGKNYGQHSYVRFAFSNIKEDMIHEGLEKLRLFVEKTISN